MKFKSDKQIGIKVFDFIKFVDIRDLACNL